MSVLEDIQKLDPGALVELFVLDATNIEGGALNRFHAGTNGINGNIIWQGSTYAAMPIEVTGFDKSTSGQLPRPTMRVANVTGIIGAMARDFGDLLGAKVLRKRTFARYLDEDNFPGQVNPTANPDEHFPDDEFFIDQKTLENKVLIEFALAAKCDLSGVRVPLRVVTQMCGWRYRGEGCGYTGDPVADVEDEATTDPDEDRCGKRLSSCVLRFGENEVLPFGGFPAAGLLR